MRSALVISVASGLFLAIAALNGAIGPGSFGAPGGAQAAETAQKPAAKPVAAKPGDPAAVDYLRAQWNPIHFKPAIDKATDADCLGCHQEIGKAKPRDASPAGVKAADTQAWYQTLDTYEGAQADFHWRHISSPFAKQVMNLSCTFCHQGNDPREESPHVTATDGKGAIQTAWERNEPPFTLRKMVNPSETCLRCHGAFPATSMGLEGKWHELREGMESPDAPNGCLTCHADQFRLVRHQVNYLRPDAIEKLAAAGSSDTCFGCHGGRAWYRISYPYPRHDWKDMPTEIPDWAKDRPKQSDARFLTKTK
ncbi:MAG: hypothetical protein JNM13_11135 [Hyphomicrobiaceae bacterium]|nr:hypothetical protein [Hyphomicrobiaceae bacterium]